jgi:hypothetical protein
MMAITSFSEENRFLSNFYPCMVKMEGIEYPSVEHAYQAAKTLNVAEREEIALLTAGQAKRRGSRILPRVGWELMKVRIMEDLVRQKFNDRVLREMLLATGDAELTEGNDWGDKFWGVCDGEGENWLGRILMQIRSERLSL